MSASWKNRIGIKLFGMMAVVIALSMLPIAFVVLVSVNTFGKYSVTINEDQIKQQAVSYLSRLTREQGQKYEEYFNRAAGAVTLLSTAASRVYNNLDGYAGTETESDRLLWQAENEMFLSPQTSPVVTVYWGGETLSSDILIENRALQTLDPLLQKTKELLPDSLATHIITTSGIGRYYTWSEKGKKVVRHLPKTSVFDLRDGAPMTIFTKENYPTDRAGWTGIYKDDILEGLMVTACGPIVDESGKFRGISGIDLPLQTIVEDIMVDGEVNPAETRKILFSFLVDQKGRFIAFPDDYMAYFGIDVDLSSFRNSSDLLDYNLNDSKEEGVREIVSQLLKADNSIHETELQGEPHIIAGQTLPTLGWHFVLVTREGDLISSVQRTQNALRGTLRELKSEFFVNSILAAGIALLLVYMAVRYFVSPLQRITAIAEQVGEGNLDVRCDLGRQDELGSLGNAMNNMISKLAEADEMQNRYSKTLEEDIRDRTSDLELKNAQLNSLVRDLHAESRERKKVTRALLESEKQLRSIMESSLAGLCIIQSGRFKYVNTALANMFGYTRIQMVDGIAPTDIVLPDFRPIVEERLLARDQGRLLSMNEAYHIRCQTKGGQILDTLVEGASTTWMGLPATVGTIVNISALKQVEEKLRDNEKWLQELVEEKDILLREVYHRTKNNMLVIISMLALQMDGIEDSKARRIFIDTENRIRAMALVHENLYMSKSLAEINLGEYLGNMVETLIDNMTVGNRIVVEVKQQPVKISFEQAIPLGLVVNELVTNSVKYAFPGDRKGCVRIELVRQGKENQLVVADNGIGLPPDLDIHTANSFGLQITTNMVKKQLRGNLAVNCNQGTEYHITFPDFV
ncbi:MAG: sensor histidine kinase [Desulforhopalus sp.]